MAGGVKRTVRIGSIAFTDPSGRICRADHGTDVAVHADDVARFDSINGTDDTPIQESTPKRRGGRARKDDGGDAVRDGD